MPEEAKMDELGSEVDALLVLEELPERGGGGERGRGPRGGGGP